MVVMEAVIAKQEHALEYRPAFEQMEAYVGIACNEPGVGVCLRKLVQSAYAVES